MNLVKSISNAFDQRAVGLSVLLSDNGVVSLSAVIVQKKGNDIMVKKVVKASSDLSELIVDLDHELPVFITINGKGILHKFSGLQADKKTLISELIPQSNADDFYLQAYRVNEELMSVHLARKTSIDNLIDTLRSSGIKLLGVYFGLEIISGLKSIFLKEGSGVFHFSTYEISFQNNEIQGVERKGSSQNEECVEVDGKDLGASHMLSLSAAIQHFAQDPGVVLQAVDLERIKLKHRESTFLIKSAVLFTTACFAILLINTLLFTNYNKKVRHLSMQSDLDQERVKTMQTLETEINLKKEFLRSNQLASKSLSFMADRIAALVPSGIMLEQMVLSPEQTSSDADVIGFNSSVIQIRGALTKDVEINEFVNALRLLDWVKNVRVDDITREAKGKPGYFQLTILLS
ncbi:MAG: hypothetical protein RIE58_07795 [Vicingaceae bacterium]